MRREKLRGVNLGGWLVLEKWISPSLFEGTPAKDEFTFMQISGAEKKIEKHRKEYIKEEDFLWLANNGVNAFRIPVGYWLFGDEAPYSGTVKYLDWALDMAEKYQLRALIDLHGAKGSQNGNDHSGRQGRKEWFRKPEYQKETIYILRKIAERYRLSPALWGIELLNEPSPGFLGYMRLKHFYQEAYNELATVLGTGAYIIFSDAFMTRLFSGSVKQIKSHPVAMDIHWYQFGRANPESYLQKVTGRGQKIENLQKKQPVIIGEWSGMISHLTLQSLSQAEQIELQKKHIRLQLEAYDNALGWFYWTYKTEKDSIWSFRTQVESGNLVLR